MLIRPFEFADNLYRGPEPATDADFDVLAGLGIKTVVDLEMHVLPWSVWRIEDAVRGRGMSYVPLPLIPVLPPTQAELLTAARILGNAPTTLDCVYVHCRQGVDRTGMAVAAYKLMIWHELYHEVVDEMMTFGFHRWRYAHWLPALREFADTWGMQG